MADKSSSTNDREPRSTKSLIDDEKKKAMDAVKAELDLVESADDDAAKSKSAKGAKTERTAPRSVAPAPRTRTGSIKKAEVFASEEKAVDKVEVEPENKPAPLNVTSKLNLAASSPAASNSSSAFARPAAAIKQSLSRKALNPNQIEVTLTRFGVRSVAKMALVLSTFLSVVELAFVGLVAFLFSASGIVGQLTSAVLSAGFSTDIFGGGIDEKTLLILVAILLIVNIFLTTLLLTIAALVYNLASRLAGGIKLYLSNEE